MDKKLDQRLNSLFSRRKFLAGAGTAAAATMVGCSDSGSQVTAAPPTGTAFTDADILNYALNLEYLEAQFYLYAATGKGLSTADQGSGAAATTTTGAITVQAVPTSGLTTAQIAFINELAYTEQQHVRFIRSQLGSAAVAMPAIDLTFFAALAVAAGVSGATATGAGAFSPFTSYDTFLLGAFIFEDVGVTAYSGGATLITSATNLLAAGGILAVEAYHAAAIRTQITGRALSSGSATYLNIANQIEALRATLTIGQSAAPSTTGSVETKLVLPTSASTPSGIVAADPTNAIGFYRTTSQVHHIAYGTPTIGATSGGFFPNGTNSIFKTAN